MEDIVAVIYIDEDRELLRAVLNLPVKYKFPIHLFYYEGYSVNEIAKILRISISSVKMRLKRGREELRKELI